MNQPEERNQTGNAGRSRTGVGKGKRNGGGKSKGPRKGRGRRALIWIFFVVLFAVVCAVVGYLLIILNGQRILSANINKLNLDEASIIYDRDGKEVSKLYTPEGNREFVSITKIPKIVQNAFVATEDKRFYEHSGIDLLGIGRALVKDVIARSAVEGASTITQQLAKNLFLNADKTAFRKGTEASIALALEQQKSKEEILELYLNRIYFGKGQYGLMTAAKFYFGVSDLDKLELWQVATLAGIPKAPGTYNPVSNPEKSKERRGVVLKLMLDQGLITEAERAEAADVDYEPKGTAASKDAKYLTYLDFVLDEAQERTGLSEEELRSAGYKITTTINTKAQLAMEKEFANADRFEKGPDERIVQGAMVIMDQHDGSLIAMVGGRNYEKTGTNRVVEKRQPGSSFKPIMDYGPAIETGDFFPWSIVQDVKQCFGNGTYCPSNSNGNYLGAIPMRQAIKESRNVSAVWLLNEIGISKGLAFANNLGIKLEKEDRNLATALGGLTKGVTPLEMVRAYGAFANGGKLEDPHSIMMIKNSKDQVIYQYDESSAKQVMDEKTAYYVRDLLQGVVQKGGTGVSAAISGRTVAGKTGTTQAGIPNYRTSKNRDNWFVGFTPEWTAAVWMGYDKTDKEHLLSKSSSQAAKMFSAVMSKALEGIKKQSFPIPSGLEEAQKLPGVSGFMAAYSPESVSVELTWSPVTGEGITYKIYRKGDGEAEARLMAETAEPAYDDFAILPDRKFTYYVTAYQASKKLESNPSEQLTVTITTGMESSPPPDEGNGGITPPDDGGVETPPIEIVVPGASPTPSPTPTPTPTPPAGDLPGMAPGESTSPSP
ncbi:PBP1A family penicillin-binding protein [Cohnella endophytica]|uniref:PBP1A family penicillin-binding protein n=1 Tax=Cohnella endophytica TaxID=2419778 RepID=A0A494Y8H9_9BACL|nr:PBP1A family penicillin-binding protein [Cohnella endophytica]RKP56943.1 PBP1A family penicillin-binding protein [Cohnella endophytica]